MQNLAILEGDTLQEIPGAPGILRIVRKADGFVEMIDARVRPTRVFHLDAAGNKILRVYDYVRKFEDLHPGEKWE